MITSALLCLVLTEVCIRLFLPQKLITQYSIIWRPDETFGWRHQENINTLINSGEGVVHFVTDRHGYRVNWNNEKAENRQFREEKSILFLGDSFIEAIQVENRFTIPQVIREKFTTDYNINISVTNAGVGGWNPNHYLLEAQRLAHQKYYLAIIFLWVANDIICERVQYYEPRQKAQPHRFRVPQRLDYQEIIDSILYPINDSFEVSSHLYVFLKNRTKWLRMKLGLSAYYLPSIFATGMRQSPCWETTASVCKAIHYEFSRNGTPCFFVLLPADYQVDTNVFYAYTKSFNIDVTTVDLEQPNKLLKTLFESVLLVDPLEYMRAKANTGIKMYGTIDSHLNVSGHKIVAEYITPVIESFVVNEKLLKDIKKSTE